MAETPEQKDLRIKTGVCKRTLKDLDYYHAEISEHKVKIAGMEEEGKDANDIDKRVRPSVCVCVLLCALLTLCCSCSTPVYLRVPRCLRANCARPSPFHVLLSLPIPHCLPSVHRWNGTTSILLRRPATTARTAMADRYRRALHTHTPSCFYCECTQREMLTETENMVPDSRRRLRDAMDDLEASIVSPVCVCVLVGCASSFVCVQ